jgi:hypothetical protein
LLSICSTMDLLLSPGSLCRSTTIGALVAPFSPVGCATQSKVIKKRLEIQEDVGELLG